MFLCRKPLDNSNNTVKIVTHTFSFYPFSKQFTYSLFFRVLRSIALFQCLWRGCYDELTALGGLHLVHVDVFFFLTLGSTWHHLCFLPRFYTFAHFFIGLQLHFTSELTTYSAFYVCHYFIVLSIILQISFAQLKVCMSLTGHGSVVYSHDVSNASLCLLLSTSACASLHHIPCLHFPRSQLQHQAYISPYSIIVLVIKPLWYCHLKINKMKRVNHSHLANDFKNGVYC